MPVGIVSQSPSDIGLVLRGGPSSASRPCPNQLENQRCIRFRMFFENLGKKPIIIINPTLGFGSGIREARIYYNEYGEDKRTIIRLEGKRKRVQVEVETVEQFRSSVASFDRDRPPANLTIILDPGESFPFEESFVIEADELIPERDFEKMRWKFPVSDECNLNGCRRIPVGGKLVYEFSFLPYHDDPNFLEKIAARWRPFGILPVDSKGTYTIISELIQSRFH